ncbi:putative N-acetyl-gamma-glutamyl-phosphate reductase [Actinidia rufa]|uniref:Putative N-acetyl-gamma-glutamyl-phosphate reductase n=1 Tax=Actinidia rufa TaxID=165716 RepID=A0A7J0EMI5_9ERIC|nr:putative N-acetyl-gamma-glutamyl-phosphate reductase [Actinidia rufa]
MISDFISRTLKNNAMKIVKICWGVFLLVDTISDFISHTYYLNQPPVENSGPGRKEVEYFLQTGSKRKKTANPDADANARVEFCISLLLLLGTSPEPALHEAPRLVLRIPCFCSPKGQETSLFAILSCGMQSTIYMELAPGVSVMDLHQHLRIYEREVVYGLPEIYRSEIKDACLVASPSYYPSSIQLPLVPLIKVRFEFKSSSLGRGFKEANLSTKIADGIHSYGITEHRHLPGIQQGLSEAANSEVTVSFIPHLMPMMDNLMKGASGQALQNLKLMMGIPENTRLGYMPLFP